jgi:hypothetical protein
VLNISEKSVCGDKSEGSVVPTLSFVSKEERCCIDERADGIVVDDTHGIVNVKATSRGSLQDLSLTGRQTSKEVLALHAEFGRCGLRRRKTPPCRGSHRPAFSRRPELARMMAQAGGRQQCML